MGLFGTETWLQFLGGGRLPGCKISTEYEVLHSQGVSGRKKVASYTSSFLPTTEKCSVESESWVSIPTLGSEGPQQLRRPL